LVVVRSNDLNFVDDVVTRLQAAGIMTWLFGGWAEELLGLAAPRNHRDLDLLHLAAGFGPVDDFMTADRQIFEIAGRYTNTHRGHPPIAVSPDQVT
jgi:Aminoglycoside-2''-adenylyltransferase